VEESTSFKTRLRSWGRRNGLGLTLTFLGFVVLVAYLANDIFIPIYPGEAGVQWSRFLGGTKTEKVYGEGIHIILPWNIMYKYDVRFQQRSATFDVLSHDGLNIAAVITVRFKPVVGNLARMHKYVGPKYVETLLLPEVGSLAREGIARYVPQDLYSETRFRIQREIRDRLATETRIRIGPRYAQLTELLYVQDVLIQSVTLPEDVAKAIRDKLSQLQHLQEYEYIVQRERREAERKAIEARGIRAFQDIVNEGISDRYLRWKGIDATLRLALSPNSKIVVIGAGQGGLPIILGNMDAASGQPAAGLNGAGQSPPTAPTVPTGPRLPPSEEPPIR
jgi:regulator of protease activity HflC (stomatin/prohibitin superfamily)